MLFLKTTLANWFLVELNLRRAWDLILSPYDLLLKISVLCSKL